MWGFPQMGVPLNHPFIGFPLKNHPFSIYGKPHFFHPSHDLPFLSPWNRGDLRIPAVRSRSAWGGGSSGQRWDVLHREYGVAGPFFVWDFWGLPLWLVKNRWVVFWFQLLFNEYIYIIYMMYYIVGLGNVCHSALLLRIAVIFLKNIPTQSDATWILCNFCADSSPVFHAWEAHVSRSGAAALHHKGHSGVACCFG